MSTIKRAPRETNYSTLPNHCINDQRLSWEAMGMLVFLLSKPDNWTVRKRHLISSRDAGGHKVKRILHELEDAGYLTRKRVHREDGTFDWQSTITETPDTESTIPQLSTDGSATDGSATDGSATDGKPGDIVKTEGNKEGVSKEGVSKEGGEEAPDQNAVTMWKQATGRGLQPLSQDKLLHEVDDLDLWVEVCEAIQLDMADPSRAKLSIALKDYRRKVEREAEEESNPQSSQEPSPEIQALMDQGVLFEHARMIVKPNFPFEALGGIDNYTPEGFARTFIERGEPVYSDSLDLAQFQKYYPNYDGKEIAAQHGMDYMPAEHPEEREEDIRLYPDVYCFNNDDDQ